MSIPLASPDALERKDMARGYREGVWAGRPNYECTDPICWLGTYSRASTSDEADMQEHQREKHGR